MKKSVFLWTCGRINSCSTPISRFLSTQYDFMVFRNLSASHPPWRAIPSVARFPETRLDPQIVVGCLPVKLEVDNALSWLGRMICSWGNIYCNIIICGRRVGRMPLNPIVVIARYRCWGFFGRLIHNDWLLRTPSRYWCNHSKNKVAYRRKHWDAFRLSNHSELLPRPDKHLEANLTTFLYGTIATVWERGTCVMQLAACAFPAR